MRRSFLLKTIFLALLLIAVLSTIVATMLINFGPTAAEVAKGQTLLEQFVISVDSIFFLVFVVCTDYIF